VFGAQPDPAPGQPVTFLANVAAPVVQTPLAGTSLAATANPFADHPAWKPGLPLAAFVTVAQAITIAPAPTRDIVAGPAAEAPQLRSNRVEPATIAWSGDLRRTVERLNRDVNQKIIGRSDEATYGLVDYWHTPLSAPHSGPAYGDCKDYVLEKRRALMAVGVPGGAMSIAIVKTSWNVTHAVLLVSTDQGEMVLDNLNPWIVAWNQLDYRWLTRQTPGAPLDWVRVEGMSIAAR
jgi:predicted transglutaminase-like cysteine proteinase